MLKTVKNKYILISYLVVLLLLTVLPLNSSHGSLNNTYVLEVRLDYLLHFLIYLPIVFLMSHSFRFWLAVLFSFVFAAGMEVLQLVVPYRSFNVNDLFANFLACILSLVVVMGIRYFRFKSASRL